MNTIRLIAVVASFSVIFIGCSTNEDRIPSLSESLSDYFPVGVSVTRGNLRSISDTAFIDKHFATLTSFEEMLPINCHPRQNHYRWKTIDEMVDFAQRNGKQIRGNCLVRYDAMPDWMFFDGESVTSRDSLFNRLRLHIQTVMNRYKGKVYCWDVVSNAVADDTALTLRQNNWLYQVAGEEYVEFAFRCAHEADSTALLFYNDYNLNRPDKLERTYRMLKNLIDKGVHIDGVGMQGHWSLFEPTRPQLDTALSRFRSLGLQVHITQLDVSLYKWERQRRIMRRRETVVYDEERKMQQEVQYKIIFDVLKQNSDIVTNVTFWGLDDRGSWLNNYPVRGRRNYPLLFDTFRCPKHVFYSLIGNSHKK